MLGKVAFRQRRKGKSHTVALNAISLRKNGFDVVRCPDCGAGCTLVEKFNPTAHCSEGYFTGEVEGAYLDYRSSEATLRREFRDQVGQVQQGAIMEDYLQHHADGVWEAN